MSKWGARFGLKLSRRTWIRLLGIVAVVATFVTVAVVVQGFDVKQTPVNNASLWVMQNGDGQRYAQVNADLQELDSVNKIEKPSFLVQSTDSVVVFSDGNSRLVNVNPAQPADFGDDPTKYETAPADTKVVQASGSTVAFLSGDGAVSVATIDAGKLGIPITLNPESGPEAKDYVADAIAVGSDGMTYVYSAADKKLRYYSTAEQKFTDARDIKNGPSKGDLQLTLAGNRWALLDKDSGKLWIDGQSASVSIKEKVTTETELQAPTSQGDVVYIALKTGLVSVALSDGKQTFTETSGIPAQPREFKNEVFAAWLPAQGTSGTLLNATANKSTSLSYNEKTPNTDPVPVFQANNDRLVLNDTKSGWVWTVPDGKLVPSSQDWTLADLTPETSNDASEPTEVTDPKPPIAVSDDFGVRAGKLNLLPVLLNDHDPNKDVLSVDAPTVGGLDGTFGAAQVANESQYISVFVEASATGSTSFVYQATDGTSLEGLRSDTATVTLTVIPEDSNNAPVWCGTVGCLQPWPSPEVQAGGSVSIPVLNGWVDPEGDPVFIKSVLLTGGDENGAIAFTTDGRVVYKHNDPGLTEATSIDATVTVSDSYGATAERTLTFRISPTPRLDLVPFATYSSVGETKAIDVAPHVTGGTGIVSIQSAALPQDNPAVTITLDSRMKFSFTATEAGSYPVSVTVTDGVMPVTETIRVTVLPAESTAITTTPITVFVTPGLDTAVDVFSAVSNPSGRALIINSARSTAVSGGSLFVDEIGQGSLRVKGSTEKGLAGLIGTVSYEVTDGSGEANYTTRGQATVYLLPPPESQTPVGMDDEVSVRAGAQVDVPVLSNDVGPAGATLVIDAQSIHPADQPDCLEGGLIFASGQNLRVLAPDKPGDYSCSYSVYARGNPVQKGSAILSIHVAPTDSNKAPVPTVLTSRVNAGHSVEIPFISEGVDPDGDQVWLASVSSPEEGFATISDKGNSIIYTSFTGQSGQVSFNYTVRDSQGETGKSVVRVGVLDDRVNPAPIAFTDYVEILAGEGNKAVINPILNDVSPLGETLTLVEGSVVPAVPEGSAFDQQQKLITSVDKNDVTIAAPADPTELNYFYEVKSSGGDVSQGSILVKVVNTPVTDSPQVTDTFLTLAERDKLPSGIDVVTDKVAWNSGSVSDLELKVWGGATGFTASGSKISGAAPDAGALVPFELSGKNFKGEAVSTFGFLHIPSIDDLVLSLDPQRATQEVKESESVSFDIKDLVLLPSGKSLEVDSGKVGTSGQRANAQCSVESGTRIKYDAGSDAPWKDGCVVPVRLRGTETYTTLVVPIKVIPTNPSPELKTRSVTVTPGETTTFDLTDMTEWPGKTDKTSLKYAYEYLDNDFTITQKGQTLSLTAKENAPTGSKTEAVIRITNHEETEPAPLILVVGEAPREGPQGGSLSKECTSSQSQGSCTMPISDIRGSFNAYEPTPLRFAPFGYTGGDPNYGSGDNVVYCGGVRLTASATEISASWGDDAVSANCPAIPYIVLDEKNKNGNGSLNFTFNAAPGRAGGVTQTGYTADSVTLTIQPGQAGSASPALEGYKVYKDDSSDSTTCNATGYAVDCTIYGLDAYNGSPEDSGDLHSFKIVAFNSVGDSSRDVTIDRVYAYRPVAALSDAIFNNVETVYSPQYTTATTGVVDMTITPVQDDLVKEYVISSAGQPTIRQPISSSASLTIRNVKVNPGLESEVVVEAVGRVGPPVAGSSSESKASWVGRVSGAPRISSVASTAIKQTSDYTIKVDLVDGNKNFSALEGHFISVAYKISDAAPECVWDSTQNTLTLSNTGNALYVADTDSSATGQTFSKSKSLTGAGNNSAYATFVCYSNGFGKAVVSGPQVATMQDPAEGDFTFRVAAAANSSGQWLVELASGSAPAGLIAQFDGGAGWQSQIYSRTFGADSNIHVRYCLPDGASCSPGTTRVLSAGNPWQLAVTSGFLTNSSGVRVPGQTCVSGENLYFHLDGDGVGSFDNPNYELFTDAGSEPKYFSVASQSWQSMEPAGSLWRIPDGEAASLIKLTVIGNQTSASTSGMNVPYELPPFPVSCQ